MQILTYDEIDKDQWRELVLESATGTWFQTPEAYEFFASMPELFRRARSAVRISFCSFRVRSDNSV